MRSVTFFAWVAAALGAAAAAQGPATSGAATPQDTATTRRAAGFGKVLWVDGATAGSAEQLARVREIGFDAIQLGPGGDPRAARAAGLGFYLDQPIGKGHLELRDEEWQDLAAAYERSRDAALLVRPGCLSDPARATELAARVRAAVAAAAEAGGPALRFTALADEASWTRHNNPLDVCRCEHCLAAFRAAMRREYGTVAALGQAWGASFDSFEDVVPVAVDQLRARELTGLALPVNLTPLADWLAFTDAQFAAVVSRLAAAAEAAAPGVPVGLTGLQPPTAFGGHDYARLVPPLSLLEPYPIGGARELAASFAPQASFWSTLFVPEEALPLTQLRRRFAASLAAAAARGDDGVVVWNHARLLGDAPAASTARQALEQAFTALRPALLACAGARPPDAPVWLVESRASVFAWWMLDSERDGMTWVRRLASHEAAHSTSLAARASWLSLLADLGVAARFVAEDELPVKLLQQRPRCVVLPAQIALGARSCQALEVYVQNGGTLLADHSPAIYDGALRRRDAGGLDALFGIRGRSLHKSDLRVREGRALATAATAGARHPLPIAETGLDVELGERCGREPVFCEQRTGKGRAVCLNLVVADYDRLRLEPQRVVVAQELRRRVRQVLQGAGAVPFCDVRGDQLPTCIERTLLRARDGRTILAVRLAVLDSPALLRELGERGARHVQVAFAREVTLRALDGEPLGTGREFDLRLDPSAGLFVEVVGR